MTRISLKNVRKLEETEVDIKSLSEEEDLSLYKSLNDELGHWASRQHFSERLYRFRRESRPQ